MPGNNSTKIEQMTLRVLQDIKKEARKTNQRLESIEKKVEATNQRLESLEQRLEATNERLESLDHRLQGVEEGLIALSEATVRGFERSFKATEAVRNEVRALGSRMDNFLHTSGREVRKVKANIAVLNRRIEALERRA